jgi:hypothetical protein
MDDERERRDKTRDGKMDDAQRVVLSPAAHDRIEGQVVSTGKLGGKARGLGGMVREQQRSGPQCGGAESFVKGVCG